MERDPGARTASTETRAYAPEPIEAIDAATAQRLALTFRALSDATRVRIIAALVRGERCVHDLAKALGMSQSAISHQLATLREMQLVRYTKEGRHVYYALDDEHIYTLFQQSLDHIQHQGLGLAPASR